MNLTQRQMAELLGIDVSTCSKYETGAMMPSADRVAAFCKALSVKFDDLLETR
ncbi:MAG: helix-turn-helix transcriptional regulator [Planctomycetota bacterium]|nr:helix-turn-helix transcriptional regulator [Planctomycetota bacterium]